MRPEVHYSRLATATGGIRGLGRVADFEHPSRHGRAISSVFGRAMRRAYRGGYSRQSRVVPWWQNRRRICRRIISAPVVSGGAVGPSGTAKAAGGEGGSFRLGWAWLTSLVLPEKLPSAANGRGASRLFVRGLRAHTCFNMLVTENRIARTRSVSLCVLVACASPHTHIYLRTCTCMQPRG